MTMWMMTLAANTIRPDGDPGRVFNAAPATTIAMHLYRIVALCCMKIYCNVHFKVFNAAQATTIAIPWLVLQ